MPIPSPAILPAAVAPATAFRFEPPHRHPPRLARRWARIETSRNRRTGAYFAARSSFVLRAQPGRAHRQDLSRCFDWQFYPRSSSVARFAGSSLPEISPPEISPFLRLRPPRRRGRFFAGAASPSVFGFFASSSTRPGPSASMKAVHLLLFLVSFLLVLLCCCCFLLSVCC